ncbi:hypothetical protein A1O3_03030 [Capronia epimyces CBS 606.96]|uniref:SnoaL-like domain-containing protein n=1 Tax=Capronia epimyces CBS 606.96 TaxID=1182542 RepID=W9YBU2_9EURO|nr:uncharacterized protein A1O3_03030 [Capronia epimyces CBS 606.96]EXJ89963.1 hypothetical protein A1O3_03030 [Capronia epimyces CBS 606.96]
MAEAHPWGPSPPGVGGAHHPPSWPHPHDCNTTNTTTDQTRAFVESLFTAVALDNFGASFAVALADDLVWTVTGSSPIAGRYEGKQVYVDRVLTPLRDVLVAMPVPIVEHIIVDGDWAVVNWRSEGVRGKNGANYDMQYAWLMRTELVETVNTDNGTDTDTGTGAEDDADLERKIVEVIGFYDGQKVAAVFEGYVFKNSTTA